MKIKNFKDFYAGLMFTLFGTIFFWGATRYSMGAAAKMGPGYFPLILGGLLTVLGVIILIQSLVVESEDGEVGLLVIVKPAILVFGSIGAFALLLRPGGLVVAIFEIILVSSFASHEARLKESVISAIVLCIVSLVIFVYGLNLQIPVWPAFIPQ